MTKVKNKVKMDSGVADKRLLSKATEFATILKVLGRDGNTLSAVMRDAWDGQDLRILNKNSPGCATEPHISIIGHITESELTRLLNETEQANGFANRFLFVSTKRSKSLPEGGNFSSIDFSVELSALRKAVEFGKKVGEMHFDFKARALWHKVYEKLSSGHPGMFGALTGRAEAQVRRIACIYAILDLSDSVRCAHLEAALAVWKYSEASCRRVFQGSTGDPTADKILNALTNSPEGMSRTDIRDLFGRNLAKARIDAALVVLYKFGLVRKTRLSSNAIGKPTEWWIASSVDRIGPGGEGEKQEEINGKPVQSDLSLPGALQ